MPIVPVINPGNETNTVNLSAGNSRTYEDTVIVIDTPWDPYSTNFVGSQLMTATGDVDTAPMVVLVDCTIAAVTANLPDPQMSEGKTVTVVKIDSSAFAVTITTASGVIYGSASLTTQYQCRDYTAVSLDPYFVWVGR
jgi:hypothetical protein